MLLLVLKRKICSGSTAQFKVDAPFPGIWSVFCFYLLMKKILVLFLCLLPLQLLAQKKTMEVIDAGNISAIEISGEEIYKVSISSAAVDEVSIKSNSAGEYFNEISLDSKIVGETLFLNSRYREILQSGYDKLSAHKVFAMEIELQIPEDMSVIVNSNVASVFMQGKYDEVLIQTKTGSSYLKDFIGNAMINTYDGSIEVNTSNAEISAESRHGKIELPENDGGFYKIILNSINGNIKVQETK